MYPAVSKYIMPLTNDMGIIKNYKRHSRNLGKSSQELLRSPTPVAPQKD